MASPAGISEDISFASMDMRQSFLAQEARILLGESKKKSLFNNKATTAPQLEFPEQPKPPIVVVIGDRNSGKTSLVHLLAHGTVEFDKLEEMIGPVIPRGDNPFEIWDTCSSTEEYISERNALISQSSSVIICVSCESRLGLLQLDRVWLPLVANLQRRRFTPVVICFTKADLTGTPDYLTHQDITTHLPTILTNYAAQLWIEHNTVSVLQASAGDQNEHAAVADVFRVALTNAAKPLENLITPTGELLHHTEAALRFIFRQCDTDAKGWWSFEDMTNFQRQCFEDTLTTEDANQVKNLVRTVFPAGLTREENINEDGFLRLNHFFLTSPTGRNPATVWEALTSFGFDREIQHEHSRIALQPLPLPSARHSQAHKYELSPHAIKFLKELFQEHATTPDPQYFQQTSQPPQQRQQRLLPLSAFHDMLAVVANVPEPLRYPQHYLKLRFPALESQTNATPEPHLTENELFALMSASMLLEPQATSRMCALLGCEVDADKSLWPCRLAGGKKSDRRVFECAVVVFRGEGECPPTQEVLEELIDTHPHDREGTCIVTIQSGRQSRMIVFHEVIVCPTNPNRSSPSLCLRTCDCALVCFDPTVAGVTDMAIEFQEQLAKISPHCGVLFAFVGNSALDHPPSDPAAAQQSVARCRAHCAKNTIRPPLNITLPLPPPPSSGPAPTTQADKLAKQRATFLWRELVALTNAPSHSRPVWRQKGTRGRTWKTAIVCTGTLVAVGVVAFALHTRRQRRNRPQASSASGMLQDMLQDVRGGEVPAALADMFGGVWRSVLTSTSSLRSSLSNWLA